LDEKLGGPQNRLGRSGKKKNLAATRYQTPAFQPMAVLVWAGLKRLQISSLRCLVKGAYVDVSCPLIVSKLQKLNVAKLFRMIK
jgi:hypothetical protein